MTFLGALDRFEGRSQVSTWLIGILHHKVQERRRAQATDDLRDPIEGVFESRFDKDGKWIRPPLPPDRHAASEEIRVALEGLPFIAPACACKSASTAKGGTHAMMSCKDVSTLLSTGQLADAPLGRRLGVHLHLMMCRHCSAFRRHLEALGRAARSLARGFGLEPSASFEARLIDKLKGS